MAQLERLMHEHFVEYASYFILDRAIPDLRDGLKPVQRRILHTLFAVHDGRYHKVAGIIGDTMKVHPHGDSAIGDALVVLANKGFFIDRQGNFGDAITGQPAAAPRYIECRLTPLALDTLFNEPLTEFRPSYDGRNQEPVFLPAKLPVALMLGSEGIAVGMSTRLLPHNLRELWEGQVALLRGESVQLLPDFPQGGLMDASAYDDGLGKVDVRARIETKDPKHVVIREIPFGTTTESLIASIEAAVQKGRVKISSINDYTTDTVEIELHLARGAQAEEVIPQLYAYTDCGVSISSNPILIRDRKPALLSTSEILRALTDQLVEQLRAELEYQRERLLDRQHWLTLEQIFVEKRVYKRIEEANTEKAVHREVVRGMKEHAELFVRPMVDDDVKRLLDIRIRRISAYDIERNRKELDVVATGLEEIDEKLADMTATTIAYVEGLIEKYGDDYPRRTKIGSIQAVDKKAVARQDIKLSYDPDTGFFGSDVRGERFKLSVSEFDLILAIAADGTYRVMTPPEKQLFSARLLHCAVFDPDEGAEFTVVYRDAKKIAWGKRVHIHKFIRNREYQLVKDAAGKIDLLLDPSEAGSIALDYAPAPRQRLKGSRFDLASLERVGTAARGTRLAPKPVRKVKRLAKPATKKAAPKKSSGKAAPSRTAKPKKGGGEPPDDDTQGFLF